MNVFGYLRVSGRGQIDGDGPERQRQAIKAFCEAHRLMLITDYFEKGVSGTVEGMDRPEFTALIEHIQARGQSNQAIVVERMDRLARDLMVQEFLLAECRKRGIQVFAVDQGALIDMASDSGDPTRKLIRQILGALAEWEKSQLVFKLRAARQRVRAKTGKCEGADAYGTKPTEDAILKFALSMHEVVPYYGQVAKLLNDGGFKPRHGKQFTRQNVRSLIVNHQKGKQCEAHTSNT